jgi:hypothetical protein
VNPEAFFDSVGGVLAVVGVFAVPILTIALIGALVSSIAKKRHIERLKMIEAGLVPPPARRSNNWYGLMITGAIFLAFGIALFVSELVSGDRDIAGGLIFGLVGIAMLGSFAYIRSTQQKEPPEPGSPGALPPKTV